MKASTINFTGSLNLSDLITKSRIAKDGTKVSMMANTPSAPLIY